MCTREQKAVGDKNIQAKIRDIFEYIIALVNEFAKRFGPSDKQAYHFIYKHSTKENLCHQKSGDTNFQYFVYRVIMESLIFE